MTPLMVFLEQYIIRLGYQSMLEVLGWTGLLFELREVISKGQTAILLALFRGSRYLTTLSLPLIRGVNEKALAAHI